LVGSLGAVLSPDFQKFKLAIVVLAIIVLFKFKNLWAQIEKKKKGIVSCAHLHSPRLEFL
jgi:hypothetical protein